MEEDKYNKLIATSGYPYFDDIKAGKYDKFDVIVNLSCVFYSEYEKLIEDRKHIKYYWHPTIEYPEMSIQAIYSALQRIYANDGAHILIHCDGGYNRSVTVASLTHWMFTGIMPNEETDRKLFLNIKHEFIPKLEILARIIECVKENIPYDDVIKIIENEFDMNSEQIRYVK